jgi:hypothetical protein
VGLDVADVVRDVIGVPWVAKAVDKRFMSWLLIAFAK